MKIKYLVFFWYARLVVRTLSLVQWVYMTWDEINDWFDSFHKEYVEAKKIIRGFAFSGARIEIYNRADLQIVLNHPYLRGNSEEAKANDFVKGVFGVNHQEIFAEINYDRFKRIVKGQDFLKEEDWVWPDE